MLFDEMRGLFCGKIIPCHLEGNSHRVSTKMESAQEYEVLFRKQFW